MREERMFRIMGQIDPELIVAADEPVQKASFWETWNLKLAENARLLKYAGWVASLMLVIGISSMALQHMPQPDATGQGAETPSGDNGQLALPLTTEEPLPEASAAPTQAPLATSSPTTEAGNGTASSAGTEPSDPSSNFGEYIPEPTSAPTETSAPTTIDGLPILTLEFKVDGMGFEGYMAHSFEEIKNANPWSEDLGITHLPVFRNTIGYDENYYITNPDWDAMKLELCNILARLDITDATYDRKDDKWSPSLTATSGDITITVEHDLTTTIKDPETPATLPAELEYTDYNMPYEKYQQIGAYLQEEYADLLSMENPCMNIFGGDYDIYDNQRYEIAFYDACEDPVQKILNYNFNQVQFYVLGGTLDLFRVFHPDLSDVVGNYPIISVEEAQALLVDHVYATTVPYDFPSEEYIAGCELVYRDNIYETYYLPYYRFYVELPQEETDDTFINYGLKTYGAYYVPAVEGKYIENMPVWELRFN